MVYLIDNRWSHERAHEDPAAERLLSRGALVCCAQQPDAERVGAKWLPLAVTPGYAFAEKAKLHDVGFVGYIRDATRASVLTDVASRFTLGLGEGVFEQQAADIYHQARIGLNIVTNAYSPDAIDSANMRCFEILATGTPLLTPFQPYLQELGIIHGETALTYDTPEHVCEVLAEWLPVSNKLKETGQRAAKLAAERHTYAERAKQVLAWLES